MNKTLRLGDQGLQVRQLQIVLCRSLRPTPALRPTGRFDANTQAAVKDLQRSRGLVDDGVVGPETWRALRAETLRAPRVGDTGSTRDWMAIAEAERGVQEIPGSRHAERILEYHRSTRTRPSTDEVPWCSSFVNWVMTQAGYRGTESAAARSWLNWGVERVQPRRGAIIVTKRGGADVQNGSRTGYHVAFYVCGTPTTLTLLGGNQENAVRLSDRKADKYEQIWFRWPR